MPDINGLNMQFLDDYQKLIAEVDRRCQRIVSRHGDQIACTKGCPGNCCRIHLSVCLVEAVSLALALKKLAPEIRQRIRRKARHSNSFGPCPLLEEGACLMYDARAVICRTHGLPVRTEYRGHRAIGFCLKNFKHPAPIPDEDIIDLAKLNRSLAAVNDRFAGKVDLPLAPGKRFTIGEALLMDIRIQGISTAMPP